jgi:hypothetical protein
MEAHDGPSPSHFSERLDELFRTARDRDGQAFSMRRAALELTRRGHPISHTQLSKLRRGATVAPRTSLVEALAGLFGVNPDYFAGGAQPDADVTRAEQALASPMIRAVAMRMLDADLSPEGARAILAMVEHVQRLEDAPRSRPRPAAPGPADSTEVHET